MRRIRKDATKVWHNPEMNTFSSRRSASSGTRERAAAGPTAEDRRAVTQHRAALEALFAPRRDPETDPEARALGNGRSSRDGAKSAGRIVLPPPPQSDPRTAERQKLLSKLLLAQGRPNVSKAADEFVRAGFTFPDDQDVHLQLLEHVNEDHVRSAIDALTSLLAGELPKRRAVLDSRLRRIEEYAEDVTTREAAARLRRCVSGRPGTSAPPGPQ